MLYATVNGVNGLSTFLLLKGNQKCHKNGYIICSCNWYLFILHYL